MNDLFSSIAQHSTEVLAVLIVLFLGLGALCLALWRRQRRFEKQWGQVLRGARGESLERLLYDQLRESMQLREQLDRLQADVHALQELGRSTKRHLGIVRYDAFDDVGGAQSFAMALFDDQGNGAILNSVVGRTDCRVYAKSLAKGASDRNLSEEEQKAIERASSLTQSLA